MIVILGGGISGLSAAYQLKKAGKEFILLEESHQLGGKIKSNNINGFLVEYGPNTVLVNNKEIQELIKDLKLWDELIFPDDIAAKNRFVLKDGNIEPIPNSIKSAIKSKLFGFSTLFSILKERFKKPTQNNLEESLADFSRRRFGSQIFEDFITPFVTGIYAGDPEKMSINYTLNILKDAEQKHGSVIKGMIKLMKEKKLEYDRLGLPKQKIFTFKTGLQHLTDSIENKISDHVRFQSSIHSIEQIDQGYQINYSQNNLEKSVLADKVICCLPANITSKICSKLSSSFSQQLSKINYVPAVVVHLGFSSNQIKFNQKGFGILSRTMEKVPFLGVLFNSHFFPHVVQKNKELISVICGGSKYPELIHKSDQEIISEVTLSIKELLGISGNFEMINLVRWKKGIPQYELGHQEIEDSINSFLIAHPNFYLSANYYKGISVSDCVKNATILANKLIEQ
ncbi:MAG: protoporphyrinogen oxidase [Flavobacteriales bacterium]|nr:protoporphyrinogen oxidase [Flavobacteriales bacterium]